MLIDDAFTHYTDHVSRLRTSRETKRILRGQLLPTLAGRPLTDIRRRDMIAVLDAAAQRGTSNGHHVFAQSRAFFNFCCSRDWIDTSPCDRLSSHRLLGTPDIRTRVLTDDELARVWRAAGLLASFHNYGTLVRILILTAQRRSEVGGMAWCELTGLDSEGGALWAIPPEKYKTGTPQRIPLSRLAVRELSALERAGPLLFPSKRSASSRPFSGFSKLKARLDGLSRVEDWCFHDIRRTARTGMARLGVPENVASLCLGHGRKGMGKVYDQYGYESEMPAAFEQWAAHLAHLASSEKSQLPATDAYRKR